MHPLSPFISLSSAASDAGLVPSTPPPLTSAFLASLASTHPPLEAQTYLWTINLRDLSPEVWDYAEFVRENAWKWVGDDPAVHENEYYTEVDKRREMDGRIVRREVVSLDVGEGGDSEDAERRVVIEVE